MGADRALSLSGKFLLGLHDADFERYQLPESDGPGIHLMGWVALAALGEGGGDLIVETGRVQVACLFLLPILFLGSTFGKNNDTLTWYRHCFAGMFNGR